MCPLHAGLSANEKVRRRKKKVGARREEVGEIFSESVTQRERERKREREREREIPDTHQQTGG